ncbi:protein MKS1-like [Andrographis paniculata]|uniref:protein MKS1-like n=1 Tax=Andrographis paniculata TaxID=175694 RepID=UPI0021E813E1|nr:protein MKS1-like [Andrographis paniculata]
MNPPEFFSGGGFDGADNRPSPRKELQGPRPSALKVNKDSYKIRKPPVAPQPHHRPPPEAARPPPPEERKPVIIYAVSPKVIHTTVSDFMNLVQRLTGNTSNSGGASASTSRPGDLSPAARLASIERTSPPKDRERETAAAAAAADIADHDFVGDLLEDAQVEVGRTPGILSPAPGSLPAIPSGFFSPVGPDPFLMGYGNMFIPSPSTLFSAPMVSPSPTSCDLFNPFFDF